MLILGIDPGSQHTGFGIVERHGDRLKAVEFGVFSCRRGDPLPARLTQLATALGELLDRQPPATVALESPFQGPNPRSLIVLAHARGALMATAAGRGLEIREYSPAEIKSAVTGNGRADKEQVARMVRIILGLGERRIQADAADALATAICCAHRHRIEHLTAGRQS